MSYFNFWNSFRHKRLNNLYEKNQTTEFLNQNIKTTVNSVLKDFGNDLSQIDAIAVPLGPGTIFTNKIGLDYAKQLGIEHDIPVYPVNSEEALIFSNRIGMDFSDQNWPMEFPFLSLLLSYSQSQIVLTRGVGNHRIFGTSIDIGRIYKLFII